MKAKFNENRLKWKEIERSDSLKPENVLTSSLKMIKKAFKKWGEPVFGNRNPAQPIAAVISFVFKEKAKGIKEGYHYQDQ